MAEFDEKELVPKWYVVHTFSGYENKVQQIINKIVDNRKIHHLIEEVAIPMETVREIREDGKERIVQSKIYPGYVYIKMIVTDDTWYTVRNTRGVTGFVGPDGDPTPLTDKEIAAIFGKSDGSSEDSAKKSVKVKLNYKIGDSVKVIGTAMAGFIGEVTDIDIENDTVTVSIDFFGSQTSTTLKLSDVAPDM